MQIFLLLLFDTNIVLSESLHIDPDESLRFDVFLVGYVLKMLHNDGTKSNMLLSNISCNSRGLSNTNIRTKNDVGYRVYILEQLLMKILLVTIRHSKDNHYLVLQLRNLFIASCFTGMILDKGCTICKDRDFLHYGSFSDVLITHLNGSIEIIFNSSIFHNIISWKDNVLHTNEYHLLISTAIGQTNKGSMTKDIFIKTNLLVVSEISLSKVMGDTHDCIDVKERIIINTSGSEMSYSNLSWMARLYSSIYDNSNQITNEYLHPKIDIMNRVDDKIKSVTRLCKSNRNTNVFYELQLDNIEVLRPIFIIFWLASIATYNVALEDPNSDQSFDQIFKYSYYEGSSTSKFIGLCIIGYRDRIKVASNLSMDVKASSYVNSLSNFIILVINKDIKTIRILMAEEDGNVLHHAWFQILKFVLELDILHSIILSNTVDQVLISNHIVTQATSRESYTHSFDHNNIVLNYNNENTDAQVMNKHTDKHDVLRNNGNHNNGILEIKAVRLDKSDCTVLECVKIR